MIVKLVVVAVCLHDCYTFSVVVVVVHKETLMLLRITFSAVRGGKILMFQVVETLLYN